MTTTKKGERLINPPKKKDFKDETQKYNLNF